MADLENHYDRIRDTNTVIWGISVDTPEELDELREQKGLSFELLSDQDRSLISDWGILNDKERDGIAFPNVYVIGQNKEIVLHSRDRTASRAETEPLVDFLEKYHEDSSHRKEISNEEKKFMWPTIKSLLWGLPRKLGLMSS